MPRHRLPTSVRRRRVLATLGSASIVATLAGCSGDDENADGSTDGDDSDGDGPDDDSDGESTSDSTNADVPEWSVTVTDDPPLTAVTFQSVDGSIQVALPDDVAAGDSITATTSVTAADPVTPLTEYDLDIGEGTTSVGDDELVTHDVPGDTGALTIGLRHPDAAVVARDQVSVVNQPYEYPLLPRNDASPSTIRTEIGERTPGYTASPVVQRGGLFDLWGAFDGDVSTTTVTAGSETLPGVAQSRRRSVHQVSVDSVGRRTFELNHHRGTHSREVRVVNLAISPAADTVQAGETIDVDVKVLGLSGLADERAPWLHLTLTNENPGATELADPDTRTLLIQPSDVGSGGQFTATVRITGTDGGAVSLSGEVSVAPPTGTTDNASGTTLVDGGGAVANEVTSPHLTDGFDRDYFEKNLQDDLVDAMMDAVVEADIAEKNTKKYLKAKREAKEIAELLVEEMVKRWLDDGWRGGWYWNWKVGTPGGPDAGKCFDWADALTSVISENPGFFECWNVVYVVHDGFPSDHYGTMVVPAGNAQGDLDDGLMVDPWRNEGAPWWKEADEDDEYDWQRP